MNIQQEYLDIINKLIALTKEQKIHWQRQNPSTLYCERKTSNGIKGIISIQIADISFDPEDRLFKYIFNVYSDDQEEPKITIIADIMGFGEDDYYYKNLEELYNVAVYSIEKRGIDFANELFKDLI